MRPKIDRAGFDTRSTRLVCRHTLRLYITHGSVDLKRQQRSARSAMVALRLTKSAKPIRDATNVYPMSATISNFKIAVRTLRRGRLRTAYDLCRNERTGSYSHQDQGITHMVTVYVWQAT